MNNSRFLARRVQNLLGESELDDGLVKSLTQELEQQLEKILTAQNINDIFYTQGYVAALRKVIQQVRLYNKQKLAQEEQEEND